MAIRVGEGGYEPSLVSIPMPIPTALILSPSCPLARLLDLREFAFVLPCPCPGGPSGDTAGLGPQAPPDDLRDVEEVGVKVAVVWAEEPMLNRRG